MGAKPERAYAEDDASPAMTFGERLAELRRAAGMSQTELAGDDLSASYVSLLESGKRQPSEEVVTRLAIRLGTSPSMLLQGRASERERRIQLELTYSRLALSHGESLSARDRMLVLLEDRPLDQRSADEALLVLALAHETLGELEAATSVLLPLFQRARRGQSHLPVSSIGVVLCGCYQDAGDYHRAVDVGQQAFDAAVEHDLVGTDDYFRLAATLLWAYHEAGDLLHASTWAQSLISEADARASATGQAAIYWNAALVAETFGRVDEAYHLAQRALGKLSEMGDSRDLSRLRMAAAELLLHAVPPRPEEAWRALEAARGPLSDFGSAVDRAGWEVAAATVQLHRGDLGEATRLASEALDRVNDVEDHVSAMALITLGDVAAAHGRSADALSHYRTAAGRLGGLKVNRAAATMWRELGERLADEQDLHGALDAYRSALDGLRITDRSSSLRQLIAQYQNAGARAYSGPGSPR
jgi:transcriptional regulator with XRE-family HTH domain